MLLTHFQRSAKYSLIVFFTLFFAAALNPAFAEDHYVSYYGSDNNSGTEASPWRTVAYAAANTSSGSTIYVSPGYYAETGIIQLQPQVNLQGGNADTTIITTATPYIDENSLGSVYHLMQMYSSLDANGNVDVDGSQTVSNITFDCRQHVVTQAIELKNRNNVTFDQIKIKDCYKRGLWIKSTADTVWSETSIPEDQKLAANITVKNSEFLNSGLTPLDGNGQPLQWAFGALQIVNIRDSVIHHSFFHESEYGGFNIKASDETGGNNRIKIHNCQLIQRMNSPAGYRSKGFGIEIFNLANSEIYDNWTNGGFSIVRSGSQNNMIHHNTLFMDPENEGVTEAIEIAGADNQISANYIIGTGPAIAIWGQDAPNLKINNNLIHNTKDAIFISADVPPSSGDKNDLFIDNNTIDTSYALWNMGAVGLRVQDDTAYIENVTLRNNIISNTVDHSAISLTGKNGGSNPQEVQNIIDTVISYNLFYNNAVSPDIDDKGATGTIEQQNDVTLVTPYKETGIGNYLGAEFHLDDGIQNPAIGTGVNVGLPYLGSSPDRGAFIQDRSLGARIEAEMNYSVVDDPGTYEVTVGNWGLDSNKSVNIFDSGDTMRIHFYAPADDIYSISVRLRSGYSGFRDSYFVNNGYSFKLDGVTSLSFTGDPGSISEFDPTGGGVHWGTMIDYVPLTEGRHSLEIHMNSAWGMIDYMELNSVFSVGDRIEAETNYSVVDDPGTHVITVGDWGLDSDKSVNIFDSGDTISILSFCAPADDTYSISVRLRSGYSGFRDSYFVNNGYSFKLDGVTPVSLIGDSESISEFDPTGGGVHWGTMTADVPLTEGMHSLEIHMNSAWGMIDYMELN